MSAPPGVLLVGFGRRGRQWAQALGRGAPARAQAVVDPAPAAAEAAERAGLRRFEGVGEALEATRPSLAVVASPAQLHADHAEACLRGGCPVLVEKPLAPSLEQARRVAEASHSSGLPALVGQNFRLRRLELGVRAALAQGRIGAPRASTMISARVSQELGPHERHAPLWEFCIHHLDLWRGRLGTEPEILEASASGTLPDATYELRLRFPGPVDLVYRHREGAPVFHWYEWLEGEHGALSVELERIRLHSARHRPKRVRAPRSPAPERALLERALRGDPGEFSVDHNLGTIAALEAAVEALG